ncbi:MAG: type I-C CRISPR-associated protein Cas7/Csd2 [Candidatus Dadabacteria bacterium]|nr:MAG: type I-C CRISPR-associated protein Cas7/Csd2 [Candidatus Dadabacteria bacterium]
MNRFDFVYIFDVKDANPNGDPDAGNLPRIDPETGHGLVTDVCLKRKVRNYVTMSQNNQPGQRIYFAERAVLNRLHAEAWENHPDEDVRSVPADKRNKLPKEVQKAQQLTDYMCQQFWDIRTFGAVMSTEVNCGQVRGPVQVSFARSVEPIVALEHAITRSSVTNERDLEKERTMGRKFTVPYAVYIAHGTVSGALAQQTGFSDDDAELLWEALERAFDLDASAARPAGSMAARRLIVFEHDHPLGSAPAHKLFDRVKVHRRPDVAVPREFGDYEVTVTREGMPQGVRLIERV